MGNRHAHDPSAPPPSTWWWIALLVGLIVAALAAVKLLRPDSPPPKQPATPPPATVTVAGQRIVVEVVADVHSRSRGLGGRTGLPPDHAMLFVYPREKDPDQMSFWMKDCVMDIDIAFISADRRIVTVHTMSAERRATPDVALRRYGPTAAAQFALEMEAGQFARRGIAVGEVVQFSEPVERAIAQADD